MFFKTPLMLFWTFICAIISLLILIVDWNGRFYLFWARSVWSKTLLKLASVQLTVQGSELIDWKTPYVIVSNHSSQLDIPVLFASIPVPIRFLAKRSLFYIPFFGWSLWLARFIPVDRGSVRKSRQSIDNAAKKVKEGPSLVIFPEGTRSKDGQLLPFKSGAFIMAITSGVPILPIAICGTDKILPKGGMTVKSGTVNLKMGTPIVTKDMKIFDKEDLRKSTEAVISALMKTNERV